MLLHIIADYGSGDLAYSEVAQKFAALLPDAKLVFLPVPPFCTLAAGFCIAQLALNRAPAGTLIFGNVAPRQDRDSARSENQGEKLIYARTHTGCSVVAVNSGETFSFIKDYCAEIKNLRVEDKGSQFRSRDLFPAVAAGLLLGDSSLIGSPVPPKSIPAIPKNRIAYVDGYGNIKTTINEHELKKVRKKKIRVRIGDIEREADFAPASFAVHSGKIAFAPGSSGWPVEKGKSVKWMEIFLRGGNAWQEFQKPPWGAEIVIK